MLAAVAAARADGAVTSAFDPGTGRVTVVGDDAADGITIQCLFVLFGNAVLIDGGSPGGGDAVPCSAVQQFVVTAGGGNDTVNIDDVLKADFTALRTVSVLAEAGDDTIDASSSDASLGLTGGAGADLISAGSGRDLLAGGDQQATPGAGDTNDTLLGGGGNDSLAGGRSMNTLDGGSGTDEVVELATQITLADTKVISSVGTSTSTSIEAARLFTTYADVSGWTQEAEVSGSSLTISRDADMTLSGSVATGQELTVSTGGHFRMFTISSVTLEGGSSGNRLDATGFTGQVSVNGGAGNDQLLGSTGADILSGGLGDDTITTGAGDDSGSGGDGNDQLAESGDTTFALTPTLLTGAGNDTLSSIERAVLTGGPAANVISATAWPGRATLDGAGSADVYSLGFSGTGTTALLVTDTGADGIDTAALPDCAGVTATPTQATKGAETIAFSGIEQVPCLAPPTPAPPPPAPPPQPPAAPTVPNAALNDRPRPPTQLRRAHRPRANHLRRPSHRQLPRHHRPHRTSRKAPPHSQQPETHHRRTRPHRLRRHQARQDQAGADHADAPRTNAPGDPPLAPRHPHADRERRPQHQPNRHHQTHPRTRQRTTTPRRIPVPRAAPRGRRGSRLAPVDRGVEGVRVR